MVIIVKLLASGKNPPRNNILRVLSDSMEPIADVVTKPIYAPRADRRNPNREESPDQNPLPPKEKRLKEEMDCDSRPTEIAMPEDVALNPIV